MISSEEALPGSQRPGQTGGGVKGILSGPQQIDALLLSAAEQVAIGGDPLGENDAGNLSHEGHGGHILVGHDREPGGVLSGPAQHPAQQVSGVAAGNRAVGLGQMEGGQGEGLSQLAYRHKKLLLVV